MIVCHCNIISMREIEETISGLLDADPWRLIVPLQVYHAMKKRGRCCGCFPNVVDIIVRVTEAYHRRLETPEADVICFVERLREEHRRFEEDRKAARERLSGTTVAA